MKYISLIQDVLSRFDYLNCQVKKIKGIRTIIVVFPSDETCITQTLLSVLGSIDGLRFNSVNFDERSILLVY